jgi:sugar phosphate isomerase/epimerase
MKNMRVILPAVIVIALTCVFVVAQPGIPGQSRKAGFVVGCQANTFSRFTVLEAIEKTAQAGGSIIEFYPDQKLSREQPDVVWNHNAPDETIAIVKRKLGQNKITAVGYGVVNIPKDEPGARRVFEFARKMGMRVLITESVDSIDTLEKLAKEYDVGVAYHHHPRRPNDPAYRLWDPNYVAGLLKGRDSRIGACVDTGNWMRSGVRPVDGMKILKGRILSVHMKDMTAFGERDAHEVPFGTGASDIKACLDELRAQDFSGGIAVEYEFNPDNNLPDVTKCIQFLRSQ